MNSRNAPIISWGNAQKLVFTGRYGIVEVRKIEETWTMAKPRLETKSRINIFITCLADTFYPEAARAAINVLTKLGLNICCPEKQTCCGQPMFNAGYFRQSLKVARHFVDTFSQTSGPIITPSSSCAAMVREHYPRLFEDDPVGLEKAEAIGRRTYEFCEFLVKYLNVNLKEYSARFEDSVTFHRSCHYRAIGLEDEPTNLIKQISGVEYVPLEKIEQCCGFGGTFSVNFPHLSRVMVAEKLCCIQKTNANWLIFGDAGCAMNITGYANRIGQPIKAMHIAELINSALKD